MSAMKASLLCMLLGAVYLQAQGVHLGAQANAIGPFTFYGEYSDRG